MLNRHWLWIFLTVMMLSSCYTSQSVAKYDYSYMYDDNQAIINPKFKVFHHSEDSSTVFYEINSGDVLYERIQGDSSMAASIKMKYSLFSDKELSILLDSGSQNLANYGSNGKEVLLQNSFKFKLDKRKTAYLSVRFRDDNKDFNIITTIKIDKRENFNEQYFNYLNGDQILFDQITSMRQITIQKSKLISENSFVMHGNGASFKMTPPPFAQQTKNELKFKSENNFKFDFINDSYNFDANFQFNYFHPESDSTTYNPILNFGETFPKMDELNELINPTRYISTSKEYKTLLEAVNAKKGLDAFWLKLGKNENNAKELLSEYYLRIEIANKFFSSYKEGWKTDRGIIYIIYGVPSSIRKNADKEVWVYGEENNVLSVQFRFYKPKDSNVSNHFEMVRNSDYKNNWYRQVDLWRQGKIE